MKPLEGIKVADFSWAAVGPLTTKYLADFGATVVKIESSTHPDQMRIMMPYKNNIPGVNRSGSFAIYNTSKYDITLNLNHPKAVNIAKRIVSWADIVIESYVGGTMKERWGLGYEDLRKIKPDIIMISICMYGQTGPFYNHPGYGLTLTALAGITNLTGWPDRTPAGPYGPYTDFISPRLNILAIIAALDYHRRTGKGQYIDVAQYEQGVHFVCPLILDYEVNKREHNAIGNRCEYAAPYGVYRCKGEERWCAISVFTDEEWGSFCQAIGSPEWVKETQFTTLTNRVENVEKLDELIERWTREHQAEEVMSIMQAAGVAAGLVQNGEDLNKDPQLKHYHFYQELDHPELGKISYKKPAIALSKTPCELRRSPCLGEDNSFVYTKILGMSDKEFIKLLNEGVFE